MARDLILQKTLDCFWLIWRHDFHTMDVNRILGLVGSDIENNTRMPKLSNRNNQQIGNSNQLNNQKYRADISIQNLQNRETGVDADRRGVRDIGDLRNAENQNLPGRIDTLEREIGRMSAENHYLKNEIDRLQNERKSYQRRVAEREVQRLASERDLQNEVGRLRNERQSLLILVDVFIMEFYRLYVLQVGREPSI